MSVDISEDLDFDVARGKANVLPEYYRKQVLVKMRAIVQVFPVRERTVEDEGIQTGLGREGSMPGAGVDTRHDTK